MLTVLGMTIGTISIVVMISLGIGLSEWQRQSMEQWGSLNIITVNQAFVYPGMPEEEMANLRLLTDEAVDEIRAMPGVLGVSPAFTIHGELKRGREMGWASIIGIDPGMMDLFEFSAKAGRLLSSDDRYNVVAGSFVINNFMEPGAMNQMHWEMPEPRDPLELLDERLTLTLNNARGQRRRYTLNVVGILDEQAMEHAHSVFAPISVIRQMQGFINQGAQQMQSVIAIDMPQIAKEPGRGQRQQRQQRQQLQYSFASVRTENVEVTKRLSAELRDMGYQAWSVADGLEGIEQSARTVQAILGGIGAISLLVAAIGIINTMVMSIYERTREIAVIKVLGASFSSIRWLFLAESSLIGLIGGSVGLLVSHTLSFLINMYGSSMLGMGVVPQDTQTIQISLIPLWLNALSMVFGAFIGLLAGLYPAMRAMRLDPVTAMRHY
jgi:ABC-type antimicrobial peptide transport system permease subunit